MKPFPALLIRPPAGGGSYSEAVSIRPVRVDEVNRETGLAKVAARIGSVEESRWVAFEFLASSPERAAQILAPIFSALISRAPKTALAVTTENGAEKPENGKRPENGPKTENEPENGKRETEIENETLSHA
jgi:hypothetical protein